MKAFSDISIKPVTAHGRALYVFSVACFPLVIAGLLTQMVFVSGAVQRDDGIDHKSDAAYFNYPVPGDLVKDQFEVSGRIESIPAGEVVYLVERLDNRFWPKLRIGSEPTSFKRMQNTNPGKGYKYTIELLSTNVAAEKQITQWFERAKQTGEYPGINITDGITVLAKVRVVHQ